MLRRVTRPESLAVQCLRDRDMLKEGSVAVELIARQDGGTLRRASEYAGKDPEVLHALGLSYGLSRKLNEATATFQKSIQLNPRLPEGHLLLALCYEMQGRFQEASSELEKVLAVDPRHSEAAHHLGINLYKQGLVEDAWRSFELG